MLKNLWIRLTHKKYTVKYSIVKRNKRINKTVVVYCRLFDKPTEYDFISEIREYHHCKRSDIKLQAIIK